MRHKLVNLCEESFQIASSHKNFSKWLREMLLKDVSEIPNMFEYECEKCGDIMNRPARNGRVFSQIENYCCSMAMSRLLGRVE
jgi:predicted SprT family Zn-dependent metalloprotease|tara:strand:+ start:223 stop:471 length:249 start_codon:yes stop_codon:yes gene_type:complete